MLEESGAAKYLTERLEHMSAYDGVRINLLSIGTLSFNLLNPSTAVPFPFPFPLPIAHPEFDPFAPP